MRRFLSVLLTILVTGSFASAQYFPKGSLDSKGDDFKDDWYSHQLTALQEPSLFGMMKTPSWESYRFLWLRTFDHPIAIRLDLQPDGSGILTTKVASGTGGFRPGVLAETSSRALTKVQTDAFLLRVDKLGFWSAPNPESNQGGEDGSQWIVEGVKAGHYHVVDRWTPNAGVVRELGLMLAIELAKMTIPANKIY